MVRRVAPRSPAPIDAGWSCGYAAVVPADTRSAEEWARAVWEGAPAALRLLMVAGWRLVLRLKLGPRSDDGHVLGWTITNRSPDQVVVEAVSPLLTAQNTFLRDGDRIVWSTFVRYERGVARLVWLPVSLLHRLLVRFSLGHAAANRDRA